MPSASTDLKITDTDRHNFDQLVKAVKNGHAALVVCRDELTKREEIAVAAMSKREDGEEGIQMVPFAILLNVHEVCYSRLRAPNPDGGYMPIDEETECHITRTSKSRSAKTTEMRGRKTRRVGTRAAGNPSCADDAQN